jgi:hypothetical protein
MAHAKCNSAMRERYPRTGFGMLLTIVGVGVAIYVFLHHLVRYTMHY